MSLSYTDFKYASELGRGSFGTVILVEKHKGSDDKKNMFAMKIQQKMKPRIIPKPNQVHTAENEFDVSI